MSNNVKETVIQFGEGGFLRGFVDYFFHKLQEKGLYDGKIVVVSFCSSTYKTAYFVIRILRS